MSPVQCSKLATQMILWETTYTNLENGFLKLLNRLYRNLLMRELHVMVDVCLAGRHD